MQDGRQRRGLCYLSERDDLSGEEIEFFKRQLEKREGS
jgi:hypothetical protein